MSRVSGAIKVAIEVIFVLDGSCLIAVGDALRGCMDGGGNGSDASGCGKD